VYSNLRLYNTLTRRIEELDSRIEDKGDNYEKDNVVRIYLCGLTVYDNSHIGHARTIILFDVLRRYLIFKGYRVKFIQNFTDVDDKIINRAKNEGVNAGDISAKYISSYFRDFDSLNVLRADQYPLATQNIEDMISLIEDLMKKGHAYLTPNGVYFRIKSYSGYGKLSKKPIDELETGSRVEVDPSKENPLDFALWKFYYDPPIWDSPWGKGRPGWHIECSAMALKYLGGNLEIHGGGYDLLFPHHENEIAQSEAYSGKQFAKLWLHTGMVTINSEKMSKSLGNIVTIQDALKRWGMNTLRIYCMSAQYSKPLDYTDKLLAESKQRWRQIETCAYELRFAPSIDATGVKDYGGDGSNAKAIKKLCEETMNSFQSAMDDNLNTTLALMEFMRFVTEINRYTAEGKLTRSISNSVSKAFNSFMNVLGLKVVEATEAEKTEIEELIVMRNRLRAEKKFQNSDELRRKLSEQYSVELMDHKDRTIWKKVEN
jgi:cysteinyl-tRNA synthetase